MEKRKLDLDKNVIQNLTIKNKTFKHFEETIGKYFCDSERDKDLLKQDPKINNDKKKYC